MTADFIAALAAERVALRVRLALVEELLELYGPSTDASDRYPSPVEPGARAESPPPPEPQAPKPRLVTPVSVTPPVPPDEPKPKDRRGTAWTPERRAEQAARARRTHAAKRQGKSSWGHAGGSAQQTEARGETTTYEEDGRTVTVCPPGFAIGATRGVLDGLA